MTRDPIGIAGGVNLYAYVKNSPTDGIDPFGLKVYVAQHDVAGVGEHRYIVMQPDNPKDFSSNGRFYKNSGGQFETTISGQPEGKFPKFGNLTSKPNSDQSQARDSMTELGRPRGVSDTAFINRFLDAESRYKNDLPYHPIPGKGNSYNSNSYARGIGEAAGAIFPELPGNAPGWDKPIKLDK